MNPTALHVRLDALQFLVDADWKALEQLFVRRDSAKAGEHMVSEHQKMEQTRIIVSGWAYRYKLLEDGRRQILNLLLPGDIIGFYAIMRNQSDYGVETISSVEYSIFNAAQLVDLLADTPRLTLALSWIAGQSERLLDEQITRIGRRKASQRMAHLFVELFLRLRNAGASQQQAGILPVSQSVLADSLGMSHVHANRSFKALAREGAVTIRKGKINLVDVDFLANHADFDANYLEQIAVPEKTRAVIKDSPLPF